MFLEADEWATDSGILGWLPRTDDNVQGAREQAAAEIADADFPASRLRLHRVLVREESEVEARINGHEFPLYVECTPRAKTAEPYWRVEVNREDPDDKP